MQVHRAGAWSARASFFEKRYPDPAKRDEALARLTADVEGKASPRRTSSSRRSSRTSRPSVSCTRARAAVEADAVLATNTSSIVLEQLARELAATRAPDRPALLQSGGAHAAGRGDSRRAHATPQMVQRGLAFARQIDKLAIACRSSPGFLVNRVLMPYLSEAVRAAEEGIPLALIDRAAEDFGMPMGPIELADVVGLDVVMSVGKVFFQSGADVPAVLSTRCRAEEVRQENRRGLLRVAATTSRRSRRRRARSAAGSAGSPDPAAGERSRRRAARADRRGCGPGRCRRDFRRGLCAVRGGPIQYARSARRRRGGRAAEELRSATASALRRMRAGSCCANRAMRRPALEPQ